MKFEVDPILLEEDTRPQTKSPLWFSLLFVVAFHCFPFAVIYAINQAVAIEQGIVLQEKLSETD